MHIFKLPDLGEGLPDAEIHEWYVKEGEEVKVDQPLVSMETAKAVVDVPSPQDGKVIQFFGQPGDVIKTGEALVGFEEATSEVKDKGTVVGNLEESTDVSEDVFTIGTATPSSRSKRIKATPAVRALARKLGVNLNDITPTGEHGVITRLDVENAGEAPSTLQEGFEPLRGVRRAMLHSMVQSHQQVVPVSIFDEVDINAWNGDQDITVRLIRAIEGACKKEPSLNAWYDSKNAARRCFDEIHLGLAMDTEDGLFVPVIENIKEKSNKELRQCIDGYKQAVHERSVPSEQLKGATITLSNFGKFAGRFASPIIVPPMVAILAVGRLYQGVVATTEDKIEPHRLLPLSLSFDHRAVTGGEATRFLGAVIHSLKAAT